MGINDFGGVNDPLSNPPLGGPQGWAAAVRDAVAALQGGAARAHVATKRNGVAAAPTNTLTDVAPVATISNAPAGLYVVAWVAVFARDAAATAGTNVNLKVVVGSTDAFYETVAELNDNLTQSMDGLITTIHTGGNLAVHVQAMGTLAPLSLRAGRIHVYRVST
jgi:hypothetical protein